MATRKKEEEVATVVIQGPGKNPERSIIQKSNPMYSLWQNKLTLGEMKILDMYLARINAHDPEHRAVIFKRTEIEDVFGVGELRPEALENRLRHLVGNVVKLTDGRKSKGFVLITLFSRALYDVNKDGVGTVELTCTPEAREYIFNAEMLGYYKYRLTAILRLKSKYAYLLLMYLEHHRHMGLEWDVNLDELKDVLQCAGESYEGFRYFNDKVLKKSQKEIIERTDCRFEYSTVKSGRVVKKIHFILSPLGEGVEVEGQLNLEDLTPPEAEESEKPASTPEAWRALVKDEFTPEQVEEIALRIWNTPADALPEAVGNPGNLEARRWQYMNSLLLSLMSYGPKNRFKYLLAMLDNKTKKEA